MVHEYKGYEPNDIIHVSEACNINQSLGSLACHGVISPSLNEISDSLNRRELLVWTPIIMGGAVISGGLALSGIAKSRRYYRT
jgi:hypothetical protein